jgi:uncharacterized protein with HEPN domain
MSRHGQRLPDDLGHITEAIERIERYTAALDEAGFERDELVRMPVNDALERGAWF